MKPYYSHAGHTLYHADNAAALPLLDPGSVHLAVTSPPYGDLRDYGGDTYNVDSVIAGLLRCLADGGIVAWVEGDSCGKDGQLLAPFRHAVKFADYGFRPHEVLIYKRTTPFAHEGRHAGVHEYILVLSKGKPRAFNAIIDKKTQGYGSKAGFSVRNKDGTMGARRAKRLAPHVAPRDSVWEYSAGFNKSHPGNAFAHKHPATFPYKLARDLILTYSNDGDTVLDPFAGAGTTLRAAKDTARQSIGIEVHQPYCEIAVTYLSQEVLGV